MGLGIWLAFAGTGGAFSLLGPFPAWQLAAYSGLQLDYNQPDDIGGPMRVNEGYRWNIPVIYYAFDQSFINYFGPNGIAAESSAERAARAGPSAAVARRITTSES